MVTSRDALTLDVTMTQKEPFISLTNNSYVTKLMFLLTGTILLFCILWNNKRKNHQGYLPINCVCEYLKNRNSREDKDVFSGLKSREPNNYWEHNYCWSVLLKKSSQSGFCWKCTNSFCFQPTHLPKLKAFKSESTILSIYEWLNGVFSKRIFPERLYSSLKLFTLPKLITKFWFNIVLLIASDYCMRN